MLIFMVPWFCRYLRYEQNLWLVENLVMGKLRTVYLITIYKIEFKKNFTNDDEIITFLSTNVIEYLVGYIKEVCTSANTY